MLFLMFTFVCICFLFVPISFVLLCFVCCVSKHALSCFCCSLVFLVLVSLFHYFRVRFVIPLFSRFLLSCFVLFSFVVFAVFCLAPVFDVALHCFGFASLSLCFTSLCSALCSVVLCCFALFRFVFRLRLFCFARLGSATK